MNVTLILMTFVLPTTSTLTHSVDLGDVSDYDLEEISDIAFSGRIVNQGTAPVFIDVTLNGTTIISFVVNANGGEFIVGTDTPFYSPDEATAVAYINTQIQALWNATIDDLDFVITGTSRAVINVEVHSLTFHAVATASMDVET